MKALILAVNALIVFSAAAQNNTSYTIIESSKALVELVKVFRMPKYAQAIPVVTEKKDSCAIKNFTDLCIKNSTGKPLLVTVYRRNGNLYDTNTLSMKILPKNQETLYELRSGIYKIKYETEDEEDEKILLREGEVRLVACEHQFKEIKN